MRTRTTRAVLAACAFAFIGSGTAWAQAPTPVLAMSFDEMQGAKANDSSPANNDGTITGAQWRADGRFGGALAFDGDDMVEVADAASLDLTTLTISAWVRPRTQTRWQTVAVKGNGSGGVSYGMYATSTDFRSTFTVWSGSHGVYGDEPLPMNAWSHIAATYDGSYWRLYRQGVLVRTAATPAPAISTRNLMIGNHDLWPDEGFDGLIDELRIYGTALSEADIVRDRDARIKSDTEEPVAPVLAMSFDDGAGGTVTDSSTYGNHGTIRGAEWTTSGRFGKGLRFDGIDDFVTVNDAPSLDLTNAQTVEAWVKIDRAKQWHTIATKELAHNNLSYYFAASAWASTDGPIVKLAKLASDNSNFWYANRAAALDVNRWYHLAYTFDGVNLRLYVDGVQAASSTTTGVPPTSNEPLRIGGAVPWGPAHFLDGTLDELRIYNRVLSVGEIALDKETSIRSGAKPGGEGDETPAGDGSAGGSHGPAAASAPEPLALPAPAQAPRVTAPARRSTAKRSRCRRVKRRVVLKVAGKRRTVVRRVCAKKAKRPARKSSKRSAAKRGR